MPDDNLHLGKRKEGRGKRDQRPNCFGRESLSVSAQNDRTHTQGLFVCQPQNNVSDQMDGSFCTQCEAVIFLSNSNSSVLLYTLGRLLSGIIL